MIQDFINGLEDPDGKLNGFGMKMLMTNLILDDYKECPNIIEVDNKMFCTTWYRHDDCVRVMNILNKITKDSKYSIPPVRQEVGSAIDQMLNNSDSMELLRRLGSDYDGEDIPYWKRYEDRLKSMEDDGI